MATEVKMPKLGLTMVDGRIVEWRKKEGDAVEKGDIIFLIETEKVTFEVESLASGILAKIIAQVDDVREIGDVVAYLAAPGEDISGLALGKEPVAAVSAVQEVKESAGTARDVTVRVGERIPISPVARKIANENKLDIASIAGSGPNGRIMKKDVLAAQEKAASAPKEIKEPAAPAAAPGSGKVRLVPLTAARRTTAARLTQSFQTPHMWVEVQANATRLRECRQMLLPIIEKQTGKRFTYTDMFILAVARALEHCPMCNSRWTDKGVEVLEDIHVGMATNVAGVGLFVPVIKNANHKSLAQIAQTKGDLVARAREGKLAIDEMTGSTITLTTLAERGHPVLNPPEACIIGFSEMKDRPAVVDGNVVPLFTVNIVLAIDHRVLDGVEGAELIFKVRDFIEEPLLML
jgi:pyruvate dehydrogenase E2 component (dihydrolipoamide acetyltransferase)